MLPPPVLVVPFVLAAGATQYPVKKFLFALSLGRAIRYTILAFLAARYGRHILPFLKRFAHESQITMVGMLIIGVAGVLFVMLWRRRHRAIATHTN